MIIHYTACSSQSPNIFIKTILSSSSPSASTSRSLKRVNTICFLIFFFFFYSDNKLFLPWFLLPNLFHICANIFASYHYLRYLCRFLREIFFLHEFWRPDVYWLSPTHGFIILYYQIIRVKGIFACYSMFFHNFVSHLIYLAQELSFLVYFHCQTHRGEQVPLVPLCSSFCTILGMREWGRAQEMMSRVQGHSNNLRKCFFHSRVHTPGDAFLNTFLSPVQRTWIKTEKNQHLQPQTVLPGA